MLYSICIGLILVASVLLILAVLVQSPKSGMAANFGAGNQVMGVRESSNFLEKFTWTMAIVVLVISLVATLAMGGSSEVSNDAMKDADLLLDKQATELPVVPQAEAAPEVVEEVETPAAE